MGAIFLAIAAILAIVALFSNLSLGQDTVLIRLVFIGIASLILNPVTSEGIHQIVENLVVGAIHELPLPNRIPLQQSGFAMILDYPICY